MNAEIRRRLRDAETAAQAIRGALAHVESNPAHASSSIRSRVRQLEDSLHRLKRAIEKREREIDD